MAWPPKDDTPYMPANGTEGMDFECRWCNRCIRDDPDSGDLCEILGNALFGEQPKEWTYKSGRGHCSAFHSIDNKGPLPEPRCPYTLELFP